MDNHKTEGNKSSENSLKDSASNVLETAQQPETNLVAVVSLPLDTETNSQAPSPVNAETNPQAPSPVNAETNSQAPSPVNAETNPQAPSPVNAETNSQAPSPVNAETNPQAPSPVNAETNSQAPSPVNAETNPQAPSPVNAETNPQAPSPVNTETNPQAPSPVNAASETNPPPQNAEGRSRAPPLNVAADPPINAEASIPVNTSYSACPMNFSFLNDIDYVGMTTDSYQRQPIPSNQEIIDRLEKIEASMYAFKEEMFSMLKAIDTRLSLLTSHPHPMPVQERRPLVPVNHGTIATTAAANIVEAIDWV